MTLQEFLTQIRSDVEAAVSEKMVTGAYVRPEMAFMDIVLQNMTDAGMTIDPQILYIERRIGRAAIKLSGYAVSDDGDQLDLFVTSYGACESVEVIPEADVLRAADQCLKLLHASVSGSLLSAIDPSDDAYAFVLTIKDLYADLDQIRVYVITDKQAKNKSFKSREIEGKIIRLEVMDIERLFRHWSEGKPRDELVVNFEDICGSPLPCVYVPSENEEYDYALTAIPGAAMRAIYEKFGARLLEANVRSFLSQTGKVNRGIRDTLRDAPERFMAYNNGIVLIADEAGLTRSGDGSVAIGWLKGMQIVNGGQTTASIYFTKRKHPEVDLGRVRVPAKILVLRDHDPIAEENLVSDISRYANSQNAVRVSDLSANRPFHVELEKLALSTYCPDGVGRWFYERAAGSYNVMLVRDGSTPAKLRSLKEVFPTSRRFTKTDLAKYLQAWAQKPHLVSLGSQKNFDRFMLDLNEKNDPLPDVVSYKRIIAQAIIFKSVQKVVRSIGVQAFQANVVAYTVALLSQHFGKDISLDMIWQRQSLSPAMLSWVGEIASRVDNILRESARGKMVSEWAKKEECWNIVSAENISQPPASIVELVK